MSLARSDPLAREPVAATRAFWSALDAAATPVFTLATLAVLVRTLSATDYGILVIALAASSLSMAVNPAIAATTTKFVSELRGPRDQVGRSIAGVITLSLAIVAIINIALLLVTALFKESLRQWIFGAVITAMPSNLGYVLLLAVLSMGIQQIEAVLAAAIKGLEQFRRQAIIEIVSRAALTCVVICVARATRAIESILVAQCLVYLAAVLVRAVALRQLVPGGRLFALANRGDAGRLIRYGGWMWLTALAGVAYTSVDRILVGRSLGPASAGQYNIYLQITQVIHFIPSSVFAFSLPAFSRLASHGNNRRDEIVLTYRNYLFAIGLSAAALAVMIILCWSPLVRTFSGSATSVGQLATGTLLTLNFLLLACNVAPYYLLVAMGHAREVSIVTSLSMLVALVLMAILVPRYGLEGAAAARLAYGVGALILLQRAQLLLQPK